MTNILSFDSIHIVNPIRSYYLFLVKKLLHRRATAKNALVLYRLDKNNILIRDKSNLSGMPIGSHASNIDALSIKFYRHLENSNACDALKIKNQKLYSLYTRQVKLKLAGLLKCAYRIQNFSNEKEGNLEITSDRQTISIMKEVFLFLNYPASDIKWNSNSMLTICITMNSIIMRALAIAKMIVTPTNLPKEYFYKHVSPDVPSILLTMPKRRPEDFFTSYVEKLGNKFNIFVYSVGFLAVAPDGYERIKIKRKIGVLHGLFEQKYIGWSSHSYLADILLIFKNHSDLSMSIDAVNTLFSNNIDVHISRQQTNVLDNFFAREARRREIFILADIMEEIFYCDDALCSSESEFTESVKLALDNNNKITFKGSNSLIKYRLSNYTIKQDRYLHTLLDIERTKKVIFYASDPSKEESQRYLTENFLFNYFSNNPDCMLVIKTHTQDDGKITHYAYMDAGQPSNIVLIGDATQKKKMASKTFNIFDEFNFNAAIATSDGFLTTSSSSILQALVLGSKSGIVDLFDNGFYDYLVEYNAAILISNNTSLDNFLSSNQMDITDNTLSYCGLKNDNEFNLKEHLQKSVKSYYEDKSRDKVRALS